MERAPALNSQKQCASVRFGVSKAPLYIILGCPAPGGRRERAGRAGVLLPYNNYLDRPEATPSRQQPSRASSALQEPPKSAKASWVSKFRNIYDPHSVFTRQIIGFESIMYH